MLQLRETLSTLVLTATHFLFVDRLGIPKLEDDLSISLLDTGAPAGAIVVARCGYDMAIEPLPCAQLHALLNFHSRLSRAASGKDKRPTSRDLAIFGQELFEFVVHAKV